MATLLQKPLKRELLVEREPYNLTISPTGFLLIPKGKRKGIEIPWHAVVNGDAALATSLNASLQMNAEATKAKDRRSNGPARKNPARKRKIRRQ